MFAPNLAHQIFAGWLFVQLAIQVDDIGIGDVFIAPVDVVIDGLRTYQPDLLFVSRARHHIFDGHGITGAPDVVVEILSDSTRRRDLAVKLPVYAANGVREVWIVDLDAATVTVHSGDGSTFAPVRTFAASDTLTSGAMPGVAIDLAPIFARAQPVPLTRRARLSVIFPPSPPEPASAPAARAPAEPIAPGRSAAALSPA